MANKSITGFRNLDENRKLQIERYQFRKNTKAKFWIQITNSRTNSVYKLPALTHEDLAKINELIKDLEENKDL